MKKSYYLHIHVLFQACMNFFILLNNKYVFWRMWVTKQFLIAIDFFYLATNNGLVNNFLQNIFSCVQQKK